MKVRGILNSVLVVLLVMSFTGIAGGKFKWEPVTDADWAAGSHTEDQNYSAVMIFEKTIADERKMGNGKCYLTVYRRIRVLDENGLEWGDFSLPYIHKKQKVEKIKGQTILRNGKIIPLTDANIIEKEVLKTEGIKIKQKSFSLPGMTDDCIIEYMYKIRLPEANNRWDAEKDIPLLAGEYRWQFYRGRSIPRFYYQFFANFLTPNFLIVNKRPGLTVEYLPSRKKTREVSISVTDVPAFKKESYSPPDNVLKTHIIFYYGSTDDVEENPNQYWAYTSNSFHETVETFVEQNEQVKEIVSNFQSLPGRRKKIEAAYDWLQENIKNISYLESDKEYEANENANDVIINRYGTQEEINFVFYDMLRQMNLPCALAYIVDRDKGEFRKKAKYWQFHRIFVADISNSHNMKFYSPGDLYLPASRVPWLNEGIETFVQTDKMFYFFEIPYSKAHTNRTYRSQSLNFLNDSDIELAVTEQHNGHKARDILLSANYQDPQKKQNALKDYIKTIFPNADITASELIENTSEKSLATLSYKLEFKGNIQSIGSRVLLKPLDYLSRLQYDFSEAERKYPIQFDYAYELFDTLKIALPQNWEVEALPNDTLLFKKGVHWELDFKQEEKTILVRRKFRLNNAYWPAEKYDKVRALFQIQKDLNALTIVLKRSETMNQIQSAAIEN